MADPVMIPTCMVCTIKARGGDRFPDPLPDHVWMCPQHWNIYLALALGPMDQHLPTRVSVIAESDGSEVEACEERGRLVLDPNDHDCDTAEPDVSEEAWCEHYMPGAECRYCAPKPDGSAEG
ncbi:hypothetical protein [Agromyces sp. NPDC058064]|uniref:hypothetical protein n=1 Tax=Agromyces sp. NPDC058064 TaxID=3346322 RepID=UPI0036D86D75